MALSHPFKEDILEHFLFKVFPCLSPPGHQWCDVLGFVPACSVSSASTLHWSPTLTTVWWRMSHQCTVWHLVVCCFPEWEAGPLTPFCLLAIFDSALPSFLAGVFHRDAGIGAKRTNTNLCSKIRCVVCWWQSSKRIKGYTHTHTPQVNTVKQAAIPPLYDNYLDKTIS